MKRLILMCLICLTLVSCAKSNKYGKCLGWDKKGEDKTLEYEVSKRNAFWSILFVETLVVPYFYVTGEYAYCPTGFKKKPNSSDQSNGK